MSPTPRDLTSDTAADRRAERVLTEAEAFAGDARAGGDPSRAPHSLSATEQEADDEAIAAADEWDDPARL
jgi:hypothetical protein